MIETEKALIEIFVKRGTEKRIAENKAKASIRNMRDAFEASIVSDYDAHITDGKRLPDENDAHVLAAAIKTRASMIVTENIKDFPKNILEDYWLEAKTADEFIADTIALDEGGAVAAISNMRVRFNKPALDAKQLLLKMEGQGLIESATALRPYIGSL